jgi:hypothetical protein
MGSCQQKGKSGRIWFLDGALAGFLAGQLR